VATVTYPCYIERRDSRGEWRWAYYAANREAIAVSGEGYKNHSDCTHSMSLVKGSSSHPTFYYE
jgi:uncharacterized protein YegP (UPF0339 family)